jgi:hypothetical protein
VRSAAPAIGRSIDHRLTPDDRAVAQFRAERRAVSDRMTWPALFKLCASSSADQIAVVEVLRVQNQLPRNDRDSHPALWEIDN